HMNPQMLFWIPAAIRMLLIFAVSAVVWFFFGAVPALLLSLMSMVAIVVLQLHYLFRLSGWLDHPRSERLPDGWGAWTDIFSRLYRLRRDDEKNQAELSEWLARFRQAMHLLPD